jgi:hypothetical protein
VRRDGSAGFQEQHPRHPHNELGTLVENAGESNDCTRTSYHFEFTAGETRVTADKTTRERDVASYLAFVAEQMIQKVEHSSTRPNHPPVTALETQAPVPARPGDPACPRAEAGAGWLGQVIVNLLCLGGSSTGNEGNSILTLW